MGLRLTAVGLWQTLLAGDLNPTLRAELPGAMRAALRGDRTPILRLRARAAGLNGSVPDESPDGPADRVGRPQHDAVHRDPLQRDGVPLERRELRRAIASTRRPRR